MNKSAFLESRLNPAFVRILRSGPWSRNPLMRTGDRILSGALIVGVLLCLLAVPVALSVGTATYDRESARIRVQDASKITTAATVLTDPVYVRVDDQYTAIVQWRNGNGQRSGIAPVGVSATPGAQVRIWLGANGSITGPPVDPDTAVLQATGDALSVVAAVCAAVWIGLATGRRWIERRHAALWQLGAR